MLKEIKKFISYFFVGGMAAIVEWVSFALCNLILNYNISTGISFVLATIFNYYLGKALTFKDSKHSKKDIISVFIVSGIGLMFNLIFMNIFIKILKMKIQMIAKILSTGLVFIWNYVSRRIFIYNNKSKKNNNCVIWCKNNYKFIIFNFIFILLNIFYLINLFNSKYTLGTIPKKFFILLCLIMLFIELTYIICIKKFINKLKIEKMFLIIAIPVGICYMALIPINGAPDEFAHIFRSYEISQGGLISEKNEMGGVGSKFTVSVDNIGKKLSNVLNLKYSDLYEASKVKNSKKVKFYSYHTSAVYSFFCYVPQSFGILVGRILHLPILIQLYFGRVFNFITWITIIYFCIKKIPTNKYLILLISLLPMCFQQAISYSPDAMTIAVAIGIFTFVTYSKRNNKQRFTKKELLIMWLLAVFMSMLKIVYIPICFLFLLIPINKYGSKKNKYIHLSLLFLTIVILNLIWLMISFQFIGEANPGVNASKQISFILTNPFMYLSIIFDSIVFNFDTLLYSSLGSNLGWLNIEISKFYLFIYLQLILFISLFEGDKKIYNKQFKILNLFSLICVIILIFTSLYVQWNAVGSPTISGVQGRYFLPISLMILSLFKIDSKYDIEQKKEYIDLFLIFINVYVLFACFLHHL